MKYFHITVYVSRLHGNFSEDVLNSLITFTDYDHFKLFSNITLKPMQEMPYAPVRFKLTTIGL